MAYWRDIDSGIESGDESGDENGDGTGLLYPPISAFHSRHTIIYNK